MTEAPPGLLYLPDLLTADEERALLAHVERLEFQQVVMHGQPARRTVRHYGYDYDYERPGRLVQGEPLPAWLEPLRGRAAAPAGVGPEELAQALVTRYPPGAPIGWHRDAPMFGIVVGVSLASPCRMRLRRKADGGYDLHELVLAPRSLYVLAGEVRTAWQHSIPPAKELRYSVTFRTLRRRSEAPAR